MCIRDSSFASFTIDESLEVSGDISGWIFFCILIYALLTSFFVIFSDELRFNILYASAIVIELRLDTLLLLNENLPEFLRVWINLNSEMSWKKERPFNFNKAKLANVNGKVNKNLPAIANKTAIAIKLINNNILILWDIFFEFMAAKNLNKKYNATKINTV